MTRFLQRFAFSPAALAAAMLLAVVDLAGCGPQPTYQVVQTPAVRVGTVESVQEIVEQAQPSGAGSVVGGGYVGNQIEKSKTNVVYQIGVKYDDGTWATIRQATPTGLRVGDRVRVTDNSGIELLR